MVTATRKDVLPHLLWSETQKLLLHFLEAFVQVNGSQT